MLDVKNRRAVSKLPPLLARLLPLPLRDAVDRCTAPIAEELRLHRDRQASVTANGRNYLLPVTLSGEDLERLFLEMCQGSVYAHTETIHQGFLMLEGGIRVGICGSAALGGGQIIGVNAVSGLILRIPHPPRAEVSRILSLLEELDGAGGLLIYSPPGVGKTTLLRSLALRVSKGENGRRTVVVDSRREISPFLWGTDLLLDTLQGYPRELGIEIAVRNLSAQLILCDEIGSAQDAIAILRAANCGVQLIATAHAAHATELLRRPALRALHRQRVFAAYVGLSRGREGFQYRIHPWEEVDRLDLKATGMRHAAADGMSWCFDADQP